MWMYSGSYRYGFNGQEKDDEVAGAGNTNTAMYWEYDTRLGRRWNLDPNLQVNISDYAVMGNNPIMMCDVLGDKFVVPSNDTEAKDDVKNMVKEKNQQYVKIDANGNVTLDFGKMTKRKTEKRLKNDKGLALVNDLVNAKDKSGNDATIMYQTQAPFNFSGWLESTVTEPIPTDYTIHNSGDDAVSSYGTATAFSYNASITSYGGGGKTLLPQTGLQGQVAIASGKPTLQTGIKKNQAHTDASGHTTWRDEPNVNNRRSDLVIHELRENLYRLSGKPYSDAHDATNKKHGTFQLIHFIFK